MNRLIVISVFFLFFIAVISARAQVSESANIRTLKIYAGGEGSMFQPDYDGRGFAHTSPQHLYGIGAYVDADFTRWIQIEAEGRWLHWNQYGGIDENTYMIGPRVPIIEYKRLRPYGKFLIGGGSGSFINGRVMAMAFGGGVDYRLGRKFTLRAFDFEYQSWRAGTTLSPYGGSVGFSYRIF